jgi:2-oxoglutarate dehydrogenase E2 component (dihydrolipoamide succinyltransferase)
VNAPEAGTIKEFLANEEDTVTVGQDLVRIELGGAPSGDKPAATEAKETPKEPAPETQAEQKKAPEPKPQETKAAAPPAPAPAKEESAAPKQPSKPAKAAAEAPATLGSRDERRVGRWRLHASRTSR